MIISTQESEEKRVLDTL